MVTVDINKLKTHIYSTSSIILSVVCMEECGELVQAESKMLRPDADPIEARQHLAEEIADNLICIETLKQMHNISDEDIQSWVNYKQDRAAKRDKGEY